jgi:hypothetical protein
MPLLIPIPIAHSAAHSEQGLSHLLALTQLLAPLLSAPAESAPE